MKRTTLIRIAIVVLAVALCFAGPVSSACLTGIVTDGNGTPILDVDLDFVSVATGVKLVTLGDNTDATGFYNVCVLPGVYHVSFDPPPGTHLLGHWEYSVDLTGGNVELNVALTAGVVVTGTVRDSAANPLANVDLDADSLGAGRVYTPNDVTDPVTGTYWLVVPPGTYRLRYDSPPGTRFRGVELDSVAVVRDTTIDIIMTAGQLLTGRVTDGTGAGLNRVSVDLRDDLLGTKVFVSNNKTDTAGNYSVAVPVGTFELRFSPQPVSRFVAALVDSFVVSGDTVVNQMLATGLIVQIDARDSSGAGVVDMDIDFKDVATGLKLFTPGDNTDALGRAAVTVPPGLYTVQLDPAPGSVYDRVVVDSVSVQSDTLLSLLIPEVRRVAFGGRVENELGAGLPDVTLKFVTEVGANAVYVPDNFTGPDGAFALQVPIGTYEVQFVPPAGSRYVAARRHAVAVQADTVWGTTTLVSGRIVTAWVIDVDGRPVTDADLDFVNEADGVEVFTPADNTDGNGRAEVAVGAGTYTVTIQPPPGSAYGPNTFGGVTITTDTVLTFIAQQGASGNPVRLALAQNYPNPFNAQTTIRYTVLVPDRVSLSIYNVLGQLVRVLTDRYHAVGVYELDWDGRSGTGRPVASGMYFYQLKSPQHAESRKLLLIK